MDDDTLSCARAVLSPQESRIGGDPHSLIIPVSVKDASLSASRCLAKKQHKLLSSPGFGVFRASCSKGLLLRRSIFSQTPVCLLAGCATGSRCRSQMAATGKRVQQLGGITGLTILVQYGLICFRSVSSCQGATSYVAALFATSEENLR